MLVNPQVQSKPTQFSAKLLRNNLEESLRLIDLFTMNRVNNSSLSLCLSLKDETEDSPSQFQASYHLLHGPDRHGSTLHFVSKIKDS